MFIFMHGNKNLKDFEGKAKRINIKGIGSVVDSLYQFYKANRVEIPEAMLFRLLRLNSPNYGGRAK